jgi:integrase
MATIGKYTTKDGAAAWEVRFRTPDQRSTRKRGFATQRDAKAFAATVETSKLKGEYVSASVGKTTVGELGPAWLERGRGHWKPVTTASFESYWRTQVEPRWGRVRIARIRPSDVQGWVADMAASHGPSVVERACMVLLLILDDATKDGLLIVNPARGIKKPKAAPQRKPYLTAPQLQMLADECGQYRSLILLLGIGGLRWGEAIALRPCDIDFLRRRIELHRNVVRTGGTFHVGTLKSNKNRVVVVPDFVIEALAASCVGRERDDLIWTAPQAGGYLRAPSVTSTWLPTAVQRCQKVDPTFPWITPHALRHTAASIAIQAGAHVKVVQRMLGHADAAMTLNTYSDLFETDLDAVAENVSKLWPRGVQAGG